MHYKEVNLGMGNVDIYLLDQILKGRFEGRKRILDAGCGEGRNLKYFVDNGFDVYGNDLDSMALTMAKMIYKTIPSDHFVTSDIASLPYEESFFDVIICAAVLHFARNEEHFASMVAQLHRCLKKDGILFIRMATTAGLQDASEFPFTLDHDQIIPTFTTAGFEFLEPWKSVVVEDKRSMGMFVLSKS